jgi:hypothetical protein
MRWFHRTPEAAGMLFDTGGGGGHGGGLQMCVDGTCCVGMRVMLMC